MSDGDLEFGNDLGPEELRVARSAGEVCRAVADVLKALLYAIARQSGRPPAGRSAAGGGAAAEATGGRPSSSLPAGTPAGDGESTPPGRPVIGAAEAGRPPDNGAATGGGSEHGAPTSVRRISDSSLSQRRGPFGGGAEDLERILAICRDLSLQVDELGAALYPPQELEDIRSFLERMTGQVAALERLVSDSLAEGAPLEGPLAAAVDNFRRAALAFDLELGS